MWTRSSAKRRHIRTTATPARRIVCRPAPAPARPSTILPVLPHHMRTTTQATQHHRRLLQTCKQIHGQALHGQRTLRLSHGLPANTTRILPNTLRGNHCHRSRKRWEMARPRLERHSRNNRLPYNRLISHNQYLPLLHRRKRSHERIRWSRHTPLRVLSPTTALHTHLKRGIVRTLHFRTHLQMHLGLRTPLLQKRNLLSIQGHLRATRSLVHQKVAPAMIRLRRRRMDLCRHRPRPLTGTRPTLRDTRMQHLLQPLPQDPFSHRLRHTPHSKQRHHRYGSQVVVSASMIDNPARQHMVTT